MKRSVLRGATWLLVLVLSFQTLTIANVPQENRGPTDEAGRLEAEAKRESDYAQEIRARAKEYEALARDARGIAEKSANDIVRQTWTDTAKRHEEEAQRLGQQASEFERRARDLRARAARLRTLPPPREYPTRSEVPPGTEPPPREAPASAVPLDQLLGKWKNLEDGTLVTIEQLYPNEPARRNELKFQGKYDWGGTYDGRNMFFNRSPKFEEMSSSAPEWARKIVEGQLKWILKFRLTSECEGMLEGEWFPGELVWSETKDSTTGEILSRKASVTQSQGAARKISLTREGVETTLDLNGRPNIVLWPDRNRAFDDYFKANFSLNTISKTQPFMVLVRMPRDLADEAGASIEVTFSAAKTGSVARIPLKRYAYPSGPAVYTTDEPVMVADPGSPFSIRNPLAKRVRLDLRAANEDKVTVSYGGVNTEFIVFDSPIQQGLAAHEEGFRALLALYNSILYETSDPQVREAANRKIRIINNARHLINDYQPKPLPLLYTDFGGKLRKWDKITNEMRLAIGERYHALLEEKIDPEAYLEPNYKVNLKLSARSRDYFYEQLGITLTCQQELDELLRAFDEGSQAYEDRLIYGFLPEYSAGLVQVVGYTHSVNPLTQRLEQISILIYGVDFFGEPVDKTTRILTGVGLASQLILNAATFSSRLKEFNVRWSTPPRLRTGLFPGGRGSSVAVGAARARDGARKPINLGNQSYFRGAVRVNYPDNLWTPLQRRPDTCLLMVMNGHLREAGLPYIPEDLSVAFAEALRIFEPRLGTYRDAAVRYLEDFGVKAKVVPANLNAIEALLKRGAGINVSARAGRSYHALRVRNITKSPNGRKYVFFEDSWNGSMWSMEADEFCRIYDQSYVMVVDINGKIKKGPIIPL